MKIVTSAGLNINISTESFREDLERRLQAALGPTVDGSERRMAVAIADAIDGRFVHGLGGYVTATECGNKIRVAVAGPNDEDEYEVLYRFTITVAEER